MSDLAPLPLFSLRLRRLFLCSLAALILACEGPSTPGTLIVAAPENDQFEIYRVAAESPLQLVSEQSGTYNMPIELSPGSYLILADCSSEAIIVRPGETVALTAHSIQFNSPVPIRKQDRFSVQCSRHSQTQSRQQIVNKYSITVLSGERDILVGLAPLKLDLEDNEGPQSFKLELSALRVEAILPSDVSERYFVSPQSNLMAITEGQQLGRNLLLLGGSYQVELNGTNLDVNLAPGQIESIVPARMRLQTSERVDLNLAPSIIGSPQHVEINQGHLIRLNQTYALLPGQVAVRLSKSEKRHEFNLVSGETLELPVSSVRVDLNCPPFDWNCLGHRKVFLFNKDAHYPFATGVTDVPLLYLSKDAWLSLEGTRGIRYQLDETKRDAVFKTGWLELIPHYEVRPGAITDLVRIEAGREPFVGHTLDIQTDRTQMLPMMSGAYKLIRYISSTNADSTRQRTARSFFVSARGVTTLDYTVYVSPARLSTIAETIDKRFYARERRRHRQALNQKSAGIPGHIF